MGKAELHPDYGEYPGEVAELRAEVERLREALREELETGWLIERTHGATPTWLYVECEMFAWTTDSLKAIRFSRREDADQVASLIGDDAERITEHQWG